MDRLRELFSDDEDEGGMTEDEYEALHRDDPPERMDPEGGEPVHPGEMPDEREGGRWA